MIAVNTRTNEFVPIRGVFKRKKVKVIVKADL